MDSTLIILVCLNALAFWQRSIFLYVLIAIADVVYGLYMAGDANVYSIEYVEGIIIIALGVFCFYRSVAKVFGRGG